MYPERIRMSVDNKFKIYDKYNKISEDNINSRILCKSLIHLSHIWINNGNFGFYWNIIQIKTYGKFILEEFSFLDEEQDSYTINIPKINKPELIPPPPPPYLWVRNAGPAVQLVPSQV